MAKQLPDFPVMDFSGGVRRDISPYQLKDNELQSGRNFEVDEIGRIKKRKGSYQFGNTVAGNIIASHYDANGFFISNNATSVAIVYKLKTGSLNSAIATDSTTITPSSAGFDTAPSVIEIEGDLINYGAGGGATQALTTLTNITSSHAARTPVHQWQSIGTLTSSDGSEGCWFAYLNGKTIIVFYNQNMWTYDGTTLTAMSDGDRPKCIFAEIFGDRLFVVGDGSTGYSRQTVYFSDLGDATSWTSGNNFTVEDSLGEPIQGIKYYNANLLIFKPSSFYRFTGSLPVKQVSNYYGIYNDKCVQEINNLLYGVGPNGIFVTNGSTVKEIGKPIEEYIKDFNAQEAITGNLAIITNIHTASFGKKLLIYMGDATSVETINDVILVYDVQSEKWEVWSGWTDLTGLFGLPRFSAGAVTQYRPGLFLGTSTKFYRAIEDRCRTADGSLNYYTIGGDYYSDLFSNTGSPITMNVITKPYTLKTPHIRKQFRFLKVFSEVAGIQVSYKIDNNSWKPLGKTSSDVNRMEFPQNAVGYRCTIALDESSTNPSVIFSGFIFEDTILLDKN